jgi:hypothetical protein
MNRHDKKPLVARNRFSAPPFNRLWFCPIELQKTSDERVTSHLSAIAIVYTLEYTNGNKSRWEKFEVKETVIFSFNLAYENKGLTVSPFWSSLWIFIKNKKAQ